jgi:MFS family permease
MLRVTGAGGPGPAAEDHATGRLYYGWVLVGVLGVLATVSYGILSYAFSVFIAPMQAELGWTKAEITGAFSVATLISGFAAVPIGRYVDRHGARLVMSLGATLASLLLLAWSRVDTIAAFYAIWMGMGIAMAAVLYEPAFAVLAVWFRESRGRALTALTFVGGFASVVFVPLTSFWVESCGWRGALLRLALVQAAVTIPLPALLLRRSPEDLGLGVDGISARGPSRPAPVSVQARAAVSSRSFRWLCVCFGLASLTTTAISVHLVPLLLERGYRSRSAAAAMGVLGLMALPGRLVFTPLGERWSRGAVTASIFLLSAVGIALLVAVDAAWSVWAFVALFGAGFGAITPARAALLAELYGPGAYGRISGALALVTSITRAAAPVGASLLYAAAGGYQAVALAILLACLGSAAAVVLAEREGASRVGSFQS